MAYLRSLHGNYYRESHIDRAIAALAARQHGVVSRLQLVDLGLALADIDYRVKIGRLHVVHRGVYAVGHGRLGPDGRRIAAVLACGQGAVLSNVAAAEGWPIIETASRFHVTSARLVRRPGIATHRAALPADEVTTVRGIPVTTVSRTLLDIAGVLQPERVRRALAKAEARGFRDAVSLDVLVARHPRHRGAGAVKAILADLDSGVTRSELEERFLDWLVERGFPRPRINEWLALRGISIQADCVWHERQVIVELDGFRFHGDRQARERDLDRDAGLQAAGWRVIRVTWRRLHHDPDGLAADLRPLLSD